MGYNEQLKLRIDLSSLGDNNGIPFFMEVKNPRLLTFEDKSKFQRFSKIEDANEQVSTIKEVCKEFVVDWNLLDIENELPIDLSNPKALDFVPSEVVEKIIKTLVPTKTEETKNSSEQ